MVKEVEESICEDDGIEKHTRPGGAGSPQGRGGRQYLAGSVKGRT